MSSARPLSASATIAVAGFSAALVITVGVLIAERFEPRSSAAPLAAAPLPKLAPPVEESARAAVAPPIASVAAPPIASIAALPIASVAAPPIASVAALPIASVAAPPIASVVAPPIASVAVDSGEPAGLPPDRGYLVLQGAADARAYVNGADVGPSAERIAVPCGARYVRIGTAAAPGRPTSWLTKGRSVVVVCRGETRIELAP